MSVQERLAKMRFKSLLHHEFKNSLEAMQRANYEANGVSWSESAPDSILVPVQHVPFGWETVRGRKLLAHLIAVEVQRGGHCLVTLTDEGKAARESFKDPDFRLPSQTV